MAESPHIIDATLENFQQTVLETSMSVPVLVDIWADWCEPCKQLTPILERLAESYQGAFVLAKVNADEQRELAGHLQVRTLPTVKIVKEGQLVDEFNSALPEGQVREILDKHVDGPPESEQDKARRLWEEGRLEEARQVLVGLNQQNPEDYDILIDLARIQSELGEMDSAREILNSLPAEEQMRPGAKQLIARFEFLDQAGDLPSEQELQQRLEKDPADCEAMNQLATHLILKNDNEGAMELLIRSVQTERDFQEGVAKNTLIKMFDLLGNQDPLVRQYRRRLFAMMY